MAEETHLLLYDIINLGIMFPKTFEGDFLKICVTTHCQHPTPRPNTPKRPNAFHPLVGGGPSSRPACRAQTCATKKNAKNLWGPFMTHLWDVKTWSGIELGGQKIGLAKKKQLQ